MTVRTTATALIVLLQIVPATAMADDWPRFRGQAGSGFATDSDSLPNVWSPSSNLAWKSPLPGPGASSPIIVGGKVLVTCYSGYGLDRKSPGEIGDLVRHLVCVDLTTGNTLWQKDVAASLPEDLYDKSGVSSHGYASHSPCSDGANVYCFFGKGGVYAFDLDGNRLWNADAGKESDPPRWGSSSSPLVYEDTVIVTASAESQSIIGFDKATGKKVWQQEATGLDGMWGTPALVRVDESRTDLVMLVAKELWGLDPANGKLRWHVEATSSAQAYASIISHEARVFAFSGAGSVAFDLGGSKDGGDSMAAWRGQISTTYASPVRHQWNLYVVSRGILTVVDAESGKRLKQVRLNDARITGNARFGSLDYASPVVVGDRLFFLNASGQTYVFGLGDGVQQLAVNEVTTDREIFWGSPAVSDGRMVLRSSKHLYCISEKRETVLPRESVVTSTDNTTSPRQPQAAPAGGRRRGRGGPGSHAEYANPANDTRPDRPRRPTSVGSAENSKSD